MTRLLLVAAVALVVVLAAAGVGAGAELHVYPGESIQDAINASHPGDTIYVHEGTYVENVDVGKRLTLVGDGADVVTVRAADAGDNVFDVTADWANISEFTVTGATGYTSGICLDNADHCNISGNNLSNNHYGGVILYSSSNNMFARNTFVGEGFVVWDSYHNGVENNTVNGKPLIYLEDVADCTITNAGQILLVNCNNIMVEDLNLSDTTVGIELWNTNNSVIANNTANSNNYYGTYLYSSNNNTLTNNNISNNCGGIYLSSSSDNMIIGNSVLNNSDRGICLYYPINNTLSNNIVKFNSEVGIFAGDGLRNTISNNICEGNVCGIGLIDIWCMGCDDIFASNNTVTNNICNNNTYSGIVLSGCHNNTVSGNLCENNGGGIGLSDATNNTIYHNNLINNTQNTHDQCTNQWDSGSEGNYYSDYTGTDNNTDGIGNDPYPIPGGTSIDRFPLMQPWTGGTSLKGDLNGDNRITPADAAIALRIAASGAHDDAADVSGDGHVTSLDALMIMQAAAGAINI